MSRLCAEPLRRETAELTEVHGRRYLLRDTALEFFFTSGAPVFLNFPQLFAGSDGVEGAGVMRELEGRAQALVSGSGVGSILSSASRSTRSDVGEAYKAVLALKSERLHKLKVTCVNVFFSFRAKHKESLGLCVCESMCVCVRERERERERGRESESMRAAPIVRQTSVLGAQS